MPKVFTIAISAENDKKYYLVSGAAIADSVPEAKEIGIHEAKRRWPPDEGWGNHACSADEIQSEGLTQLVQSSGSIQTEPVLHRAMLGGDIVGSSGIAVQVVERLSKADPSKVQEIAASQVELLTIYHNLVLEQARRSFKWALIAAGVGLGFFLAAVGFVLLQQPQNVATISLISGALIEVISAINFYLYGRTSAQLATFQTRLDQTQRFLLANSVCEGIDGEARQRARAELVAVIANTRFEQAAAGSSNSAAEIKS